MKHVRAVCVAAAVALACGTAGCAYFNTFYYARSQFRVAYPRRVDAYLATGSPTPTQSAALDSARVRCQRVIARYRGSKWADDAYLLAGQCYFGKGKYPEAIQKLSAVRDSFPKSDLHAEATTFRGAARIRYGEVDAGRSDLVEVRERWPKFEYRDLATYLLAESYREDRNWNEALPLYAEIVEKNPNSPVFDRAALQAGTCLNKLRRFDDARAFLSRVGRRHKTPSDVQFEALHITGETYLDERKYPEAEKVFRAVLTQVDERMQSGQVVLGNPTQIRSETRIHIAQAQNGQGDHDGALKTLQAVVDDNPRTQYAAEAQFAIGYTYEVYLNDAQKAREAYAEVRTQGPGTQFASRADARSSNLERLRSLRLSAASDPAERAFTAAELTLIDLEKPQDAMAQYALVVRRYPRSDYAQKAAYALAWCALHVTQDTTRAAAAFGDLLRRYPGSVYADDARFMLRRLGVTDPDSTPLVIDWAALSADSTAVADSLAPFELRADSLARAEVESDSLRARAARARADSIRQASIVQDSIDATKNAQQRTGRERDDRPKPRPRGGRPSPFGTDATTPPPPASVRDSTRGRDE